MSDKTSGEKSCSLKDSFPEVKEILDGKPNAREELKSKNINRKKVDEGTGCVKTFELCKVLQDPKSPEDVTIIKETLTTEVQRSCKNPRDKDALSNRYIYSKEVIKPYVESEDDDCNPDVLVCDALEAASDDFPSFTYCCTGPDKPASDSSPKDQKEKKNGNCCPTISSKCPPETPATPTTPPTQCRSKCYENVKVSPDSVIAIKTRNKLYFTDKSNICKKRRKCPAESKDCKTCDEFYTNRENCEKQRQAFNSEAHCKAVATLKLAAQDMLSKAYSAVHTICNRDEDDNIRIPKVCPKEKPPKKCGFEFTQSTSACKIEFAQNVESADNGQNTSNIVEKAFLISKNAVNKICSLHDLLIREDLARFGDNITDNILDSNGDTKHFIYENDIVINEESTFTENTNSLDNPSNQTSIGIKKLNQTDDTKIYNEDEIDQLEPQEMKFYVSRTPSSFLDESDTKNDGSDMLIDPNKLKFFDHNVSNVVRVKNVKQSSDEKPKFDERQIGMDSFGNDVLDSVGKLADSAFTVSANAAEKIKQKLEHFVDKKDYKAVSKQEENEDLIIETNNEIQNSNVRDTFIETLNAAKNKARTIAVTGVDMLDKMYNSSTALASTADAALKPPSSEPVVGPKAVEPSELKPPLEGMTQHLIRTTAAHISKKLDENNTNAYDIPMPNPRSVSADDEDDIEKNTGVIGSLKSKFYSMFHD